MLLSFCTTFSFYYFTTNGKLKVNIQPDEFVCFFVKSYVPDSKLHAPGYDRCAKPIRGIFMRDFCFFRMNVRIYQLRETKKGLVRRMISGQRSLQREIIFSQVFSAVIDGLITNLQYSYYHQAEAPRNQWIIRARNSSVRSTCGLYTRPIQAGKHTRFCLFNTPSTCASSRNLPSKCSIITLKMIA